MISSEKPALFVEGAGRRIRSSEVLFKHTRAAHPKLATHLVTRRNQLAAARVSHLKLDPGQGRTHCATEALAVQWVAQHHTELAHAVALEQGVACQLPPALKHRSRQRHRARNHEPQHTRTRGARTNEIVLHAAPFGFAQE